MEGHSHSGCCYHRPAVVVADTGAAALEAAADAESAWVKACWLFLLKLVMAAVDSVLVEEPACRRSCLCFRNTW